MVHRLRRWEPVLADARLASCAAGTLRDARPQSGRSRREAARRAGTSPATLPAYAAGAKSPSIVACLRVLEAYGYPFDIAHTRRIRERDGIDPAKERAGVLRLDGILACSVAKDRFASGGTTHHWTCFDLAVFKVFFDRTRNWADLETMEQAGTLDIDRVRSTLMEYLGADDERLASL